MGVPADIGFVHILVNKCMPSLIMIGSAAGSGMAVASLLSSHELIPVPFKVVYQDHVAHRHDVVGAVHKALAHERVQEDRNYFEIAVDDAIRAVRNASTAGLTEQGWMLRHEHARGEPGDPPHRIIVCPECGTGWYELTSWSDPLFCMFDSAGSMQRARSVKAGRALRASKKPREL